MNSRPLNLLLVGSHQAEIIIVKRLFQGCDNVTGLRVEPGLCDQGRRKNDVVTLPATLPTLVGRMVTRSPLDRKANSSVPGSVRLDTGSSLLRRN